MQSLLSPTSENGLHTTAFSVTRPRDTAEEAGAAAAACSKVTRATIDDTASGSDSQGAHAPSATAHHGATASSSRQTCRARAPSDANAAPFRLPGAHGVAISAATNTTGTGSA